MRVASAATLCAVLLLVLARLGVAKITDATVSKDDRSLILMETPFGFGAGGHINITLANFALRPLFDHAKGDAPKPDFSRLGFFITTADAEPQLELDLQEGKCALDATDSALTLFTFDAVDPTTHAIERGYALAELGLQDYAGGEFSLFFANCEPDSAVDFDAHIALYNVKPSGRLDFLAVGEDMLPTVYLLVFILFLGLSGLWIWMVVSAKGTAHSIHYLMIVLVVFKSLTVLSQAGMYHMIGIHGHPDGWNIAFYIFTFMRGILFFTVVILIGTGWSYMKPFLADREKNILMFVVPLQVFANVAIIVLDEFTPAAESWFTWRDILHLVDIICCCAILFPIVWSIKHLRECSEIDGKAARNLVKLTLFRQFYVMVVSFVYTTRIIVYLLQSTMPYKYIWIADAAGELATVAFYVAVGLKFRPASANPYFVLETDDGVEMQHP